MQFISTRGGMSPIGFTDVLLQGLGPDGASVFGLYFYRFDDKLAPSR